MTGEIFLTKDQFDKLPYKSTTVKKQRTYGQIIGLLAEHGIEDYQFTKYLGTELLSFPITVNRNEANYTFTVKMTVPRLHTKRPTGRGRNAPQEMVYLEDQSWRIFHWYLKSKLEAIEYGISDTVKEFMYHINYQLPDGREISLGQTLIDNVDNVTKLAALEDKKPVEADYKIKGDP